MNTTAERKKMEAKPDGAKFKLPAGTALLAKPSNPANDFKCVRCKWEWVARKKGELPARCPHCSSPAWNRAYVKAHRYGAKGPNCRCQKCGHAWTAVKTEGKPVICPKCHRYGWEDTSVLPSAKPLGVK